MSGIIRSKPQLQHIEFTNNIVTNRQALKKKQRTLNKIKSEIGEANTQLQIPVKNKKVILRKLENLKTQLERQQDNSENISQFDNFIYTRKQSRYNRIYSGLPSVSDNTHNPLMIKKINF